MSSDAWLYNRRKRSMMMEENHHTKRIIEKKKTKAAAIKNKQLIPRDWRSQEDINNWLTSLDLFHLAMLFDYHKVSCLSLRQHSQSLHQVPIPHEKKHAV
jgi:hypothetical protein